MNPPVDRLVHLRMAMEQIAVESMGALSASDADAWVREHLAAGCEVCHEAAQRISGVFDELLLTASPVEPSPSVRSRVLAAIRGAASSASPAASSDPRASAGATEDVAKIQVWNRWPATDSKFYTLSGEGGEWQDTAIAGIQARVLRVDEQRDEVTMLVRMAAGTAYPSHRHGGDEQCYVLQGDLQVEELEMKAGDYQFAPAGSIHGVQRTRTGCTLLLVSSRRDEILAG